MLDFLAKIIVAPWGNNFFYTRHHGEDPCHLLRRCFYAGLHVEDPWRPLRQCFYVGLHSENPFHPLRQYFYDGLYGEDPCCPLRQCFMLNFMENILVAPRCNTNKIFNASPKGFVVSSTRLQITLLEELRFLRLVKLSSRYLELPRTGLNIEILPKRHN